MKILYSHRTKSADGQYVHISALTEALAARGHEIVMAGPDDAQGAARRLDADAGEGGLRKLLPKPLYEAAEIAYSVPAFLRLRAKAVDVDILYERYNLFYHSGMWLARSHGLPMILEVNAPLALERARHGGLALKGLAQASERAIWRAADHVAPVTGVLARMVEAAGVSRSKITVIQNGVEQGFLAAANPAPVRARYGLEGKLVLGFSGFVRDWHGVGRILRYMARSVRPDLHFLLVGDGRARQGLECEARALGLADRFTVTGVVQRDAMPAHVAAFDIALQPAVVPYASPLKLFEYMAAGRAILAPASENISEVLTDGEDALLFSPDDEASLFQGLDRLVADASLRERLGARARASLVRQNLTWAGNAARVEKIAEGMLRENRESKD